jgi:hypothetical protein
MVTEARHSNFFVTLFFVSEFLALALLAATNIDYKWRRNAGLIMTGF